VSKKYLLSLIHAQGDIEESVTGIEEILMTNPAIKRRRKMQHSKLYRMIPTFGLVAVFALTASSLVKAQNEDVRGIVGTWILSWFRRVTRKWWLSLLLLAAGSLTAEASRPDCAPAALYG
jgi:hypothetical protein